MTRLLLSLALALLAAPVAAQTKTDPARLSDMVKTLASDPFEGRSPGTAGEPKQSRS